MRKAAVFIVVFLVLLAAPAGIRYLRFYQLTSESRELPAAYDPATIEEVPTPPATDFTDDPEIGDGYVLLDQGHSNSFTLDEISYLDGRLAARGVELLPFTGGDLAAALRPVTAFVVITPLAEFSLSEIRAVSDFVARGGRLLMVGDPTRFEIIFDEEDPFSFDFEIDSDKIPLNSLANTFDIIYNGDYLYNVTENEGNFRNIILRENGFAEAQQNLTLNLHKLAFYGSHSLQVGPEGSSLFTADENTWSTATDRPGGLTLAATSSGGRVLALGDIHFLTGPYYTVFDNGRFITHIADFLTQPADRNYVLADFPFFFTDDIDLIYTGSPDLGPDAFDEIIALQVAFREVNQTLSLSAEPGDGHDALYFGIYNQSDDVSDFLATAAITLTIDPPILTDDELADLAEGNDNNNEGDADGSPDDIRLVESAMGSVQMAGTSLILLDDTNGRRSVVVLAASKEGLESTINRLLALVTIHADSVLSDCLLREGLALCPTGVDNEVVEAELITGGGPETTPIEPTPTPTEETDANENDNSGTEEIAPEGISQGGIGLGETMEGALAEGEAHLWVFSGGPALIDISMTGDENVDGVLEIYGPDNSLIASADNTFSGETEQLTAVDIPDDGEYIIRVRDFFGNEGSYTLTLLASEG